MRKETDNQQTFLILLSNTFYMHFRDSKGTIKTQTKGSHDRVNGNFNSIKVQLKLSGVGLNIASFCDFNSIKVQLKQQQVFLAERQRYFNSIKVQLKLLRQTSIGKKHNNFNSIKVQLKLPARTNFTLHK